MRPGSFDPNAQDRRDAHWMLGEPKREPEKSRVMWNGLGRAERSAHRVRIVTLWVAIALVLMGAWALLRGCAGDSRFAVPSRLPLRMGESDQVLTRTLRVVLRSRGMLSDSGKGARTRGLPWVE